MAKIEKKYYALRSFLTYLSRYKLRVFINIIGFVIADVFLAVIPVFIGLLVGELAASKPNYATVYIYAGILIACSVMHWISWHSVEAIFMKTLRPLGYAYEKIIFSEVIRKPYPYFIDKFTGKISANIAILDQEFQDFLQTAFYSYIVEIVRLVSILIILTSMNVYTGLVFLIGIVLMFLVGSITIKNSTKYKKQETDVSSTKTGKVVDIIANFANVKSFSREQAEIKNINNQILLNTEMGNRSFLWNIVFWGSVGLFVRGFIWPITILLNIWLFSHQQMSIAEFTTVLSVIVLFSDFIWGTVWTVSTFNLKLARIEEAHQYIFGKVNIVKEYYKTEEQQFTAPAFKNTLELKNISFAYPDEKNIEVLANINLTIKSGEKLGIVGRSGSGKTTLTKLLLGYYSINEGEVIIDDKQVSPAELARLIAFVPQDTSLFHRSIAENIAYASDRPVIRADVAEAAKKAHADEFISKIDRGYDALVGERGVKLSGGQRQRIAIARAILKDSPILVLDEATSSLDSESEKLIQASLSDLMKQRTSIVIAHRLSTIAKLDRIIVLDKGRIVEDGTHAELLHQAGIYATLWSHQSGGFIEE